MENAQKTLIALLAVAIVVVGYFIYKERSGNTDEISQNENSTEQVKGPSFSGRTDDKNISIQTQIVNVSGLLAMNPGDGGTAEQLKSFSAKVSTYAVDTSTVDVTSCSPNPVVSRTKIKKPIVFNNSDTGSHKIINGNIIIDVPANGTKSVTPAFQGPGIYGYSCDSRIVGIFLVMP